MKKYATGVSMDLEHQVQLENPLKFPFKIRKSPQHVDSDHELRKDLEKNEEGLEGDNVVERWLGHGSLVPAEQIERWLNRKDDLVGGHRTQHCTWWSS
jgi:hypothetical protein